MIDLHNHTPLCHHASGDPGEMVRRAASRGIREYGFSEHSPWMHQYKGERIAPTPDEFEQYVAWIGRLQTTVAREEGIALRLGIEMDFIPERLAEAEAMAAAHPFDFHIGSIHNIGDWIFDHPDHVDEWERRDVDAVYEEYFALMRAMLEWGGVDILGHLDLPKKFGHRPRRGTLDFVEELLPLLSESGITVEVNTAGLNKPVGEMYPSEEVVRRLARAGIPLTLGSDAHRLEDVGGHLAVAMDLLRSCGVREIMTFERRRRVGLRL